MIAKVILGTMTNARKLVSIAERISCDVELCSGRYVVNAKSMLGVLSMPEFEYGELHIHTDEENECNQILEKLLENGLLALKSVLEKENVETEGMLLNEKYFPCRFSVAYGAAGKRHHALCDSSSERKRKYYFI